MSAEGGFEPSSLPCPAATLRCRRRTTAGSRIFTHTPTNQPNSTFKIAHGVVAKKLTSSPAADFWEYPWIDAPLTTFTARDGAAVHTRVYKPANFRKGGPAVVFVHGAGYLQNVHKWWSSYSHEYLFHHLLMERGFMVIDLDYRGRPAMAAIGGPASIVTWAARIWRIKWTPRNGCVAAWRGSETYRDLWRKLRRVHHAHGDVHYFPTFSQRARRYGPSAIGPTTITGTLRIF